MNTTNTVKFDNTVRRYLFNSETKFAVSQSDKISTLTGYALVWNQESTDRGGYVVKLLPNSAQFLTPTFALSNHDYNQVLARNDDNSLRISNDNYGVKVEIDLPQTSYADDLKWLVANNKVTGMSFAMLPGGDYTESSDNGVNVVTFSKFQADEITITPIPAFDRTNIALKNDDDGGDEAMSIKLSDTKKELDAHRLKLERYKVSSYLI